MLILFQYVESIATTSQPVLVQGETGVGKELIARAIHRLSGLKG
jgi:transcriptional regulator with GAF, ATPase, and Fis domain